MVFYGYVPSSEIAESYGIFIPNFQGTSIPFSIVAVSIYISTNSARTWKQPRCPSTDEWIKKLWYIYTMEYYSAIKRNAFESVLMR